MMKSRPRARRSAHGRVRALALAISLALCAGAAPAHAQIAIRLNQNQWTTAAGGALLAAALFDGVVREEALLEGDGRFDGFARLTRRFGEPETTVPVLAATWGLSKLAGHHRLAASASRIVTAMTATTVAAGAMKFTVGRKRPFAGDRDEFNHGSFHADWQSFPSGHTATAFGLATAIASEADHTWIRVAAYSAAGLTGWARIYQDRHWTSDVVAGAILGTVVSHQVMKRLKPRPER
jgi:membrane-associated phospholipid phosphatase